MVSWFTQCPPMPLSFDTSLCNMAQNWSNFCNNYAHLLCNRPMLQKIWSFTTHILSRLLIMFRRFNLTVPACLQLYQYTLRSQIEGYTRLLIFRIFSILPAVIWAYSFNNFQQNFQPICFFTYTNEIFSILPAVIRAYPLIKFEEKFQPTLLIEPPLVLET